MNRPSRQLSVSFRPELEPLEDRLALAAPALPAADLVAPSLAPAQARMGQPIPGGDNPGWSNPAGLGNAAYRFTLGPITIVIEPKEGCPPESLIVLGYGGMGAMGPSAQTEGLAGVSVALPAFPEMARGTAAPDSGYLLVSILFPSSRIAPPPPVSTGPAAGAETFALFVPRTPEPARLPADGLRDGKGAAEELFGMFPTPDRKQVQEPEDRKPEEPPSAGRLAAGAATASAAGPADKVFADRSFLPAHVGSPKLPGWSGSDPATESADEVFADPSFLPSHVGSPQLPGWSRSDPDLRVSLGLVLLAALLIRDPEPAERKSGNVSL